ncbi:hypothetical protein HPG69_019093, partial [Diceros bicornis minor]
MAKGANYNDIKKAMKQVWRAPEEHPGLHARPAGCLCDNHYPTFDTGTTSSSTFLGMTMNMARATAWWILRSTQPLRSKNLGLPTL